MQNFPGRYIFLLPYKLHIKLLSLPTYRKPRYFISQLNSNIGFCVWQWWEKIHKVSRLEWESNTSSSELLRNFRIKYTPKPYTVRTRDISFIFEIMENILLSHEIGPIHDPKSSEHDFHMKQCDRCGTEFYGNLTRYSITIDLLLK